MKFAPEIPGSTRAQSGNDFPGLRPGTSRGLVVQLVIVFLASYLLLFAAMSRRPGMYDEGIALTGAMRVMAGQIPHRDFYFIYGPAEIYLLAGLFKVFGTSLLTERLFDLLMKALTVTSVYGILSSYCRRSINVFTCMITLLWVYGFNVFGLALTPVALLNLIGSALILPVFAGSISKRRMLAAGMVSGMATLFRYDTGIALLGIHVFVIALGVWLGSTGAANRLRLFASALWPYLLGFAAVTTLPALYYLSVAPLSSILHDIVRYPAKYYYRSRHTPFPGIHLRELEEVGVYLPLAIAAVSLYTLVYKRWRVDSTTDEQKWRGFVITFGLLLLVMYLKGLVRVAPVQMYLAILPSLLLIAVLYQQKPAFPRAVRIAISCLMGLGLLPATWMALHEIRLEYLQHSFLLTRRAPPQIGEDWCKTEGPLTQGICFLPEDDRIHAIEFIRSHTHPGQPLYSGLGHHDKAFANDNLVYFATQRLPATRWSHFDPNLQSRYDIQTQIIQELEHNPPPYILLDSEFDQVREPNDSSISSGVTLLDNYIGNKYQPSETFGQLAIWRRANP